MVRSSINTLFTLTLRPRGAGAPPPLPPLLVKLRRTRLYSA